MKTIKNIDDKPSHFQEDVLPETMAALPTYRRMFKNAVGTVAARNGEEAIDLYQLGLKLKMEGSDISLEDAEFKLLKDTCEKNPAQWMAHFQAQVLLKIKES